jgi:large subunit ribosomal protein L17
MKHRRGFNPIERMAAHRKALIRNMAGSLFFYGRVKTTKAKALEVRRYAERLITRAKVDSVANRRLVSARLYDEGMVAKLFNEIASRMKERPGGYTKVIKIGRRRGDAAEMVFLQLVDYEPKEKKDKNDKSKSKKTEEKV